MEGAILEHKKTIKPLKQVYFMMPDIMARRNADSIIKKIGREARKSLMSRVNVRKMSGSINISALLPTKTQTKKEICKKTIDFI